MLCATRVDILVSVFFQAPRRSCPFPRRKTLRWNSSRRGFFCNSTVPFWAEKNHRFRDWHAEINVDNVESVDEMPWFPFHASWRFTKIPAIRRYVRNKKSQLGHAQLSQLGRTSSRFLRLLGWRPSLLIRLFLQLLRLIATTEGHAKSPDPVDPNKLPRVNWVQPGQLGPPRRQQRRLLLWRDWPGEAVGRVSVSTRHDVWQYLFLLVTGATLVVTGALLVVTMFAIRIKLN